jgi:hypothetical protein
MNARYVCNSNNEYEEWTDEQDAAIIIMDLPKGGASSGRSSTTAIAATSIIFRLPSKNA